jgi:hypothetical protein
MGMDVSELLRMQSILKQYKRAYAFSTEPAGHAIRSWCDSIKHLSSSNKTDTYLIDSSYLVIKDGHIHDRLNPFGKPFSRCLSNCVDDYDVYQPVFENYYLLDINNNLVGMHARIVYNLKQRLSEQLTELADYVKSINVLTGLPPVIHCEKYNAWIGKISNECFIRYTVTGKLSLISYSQALRIASTYLAHEGFNLSKPCIEVIFDLWQS